MYKGIDVSEHQGTINWKKVKAAGCRFAILRAMKQNGKADIQFLANARGCQENGIPYEVYRYTYALLPTEALEEAKQVVQLLQSQGNRQCRIWWDVEDKSLEKLGREVLTGLIRTAENTILGAGYDFGIYTDQAFYQAGHFDASAFDCPFWIALYPISRKFTFAENPPSEEYKPRISHPLFAWQYTSKGSISGISTPVDLDVCYMPFWKTKTEYYLEEVFHGSSISAALESIGADGSYHYREEIAVANQILDYKGTSTQNTRMLELLRTGKLIKP